MDKKIAIIFKVERAIDSSEEEMAYYIPWKVVEGVLEDNFFQDTNGQVYPHITTEQDEDLCFAFPTNESNLLIEHQGKSLTAIKKALLESAKAYKYFRNYFNNNVFIYRKGDKEAFLLRDECLDVRDSIIDFFVKAGFSGEQEEPEEETQKTPSQVSSFQRKELDIKEMYEYVTKKIIGQDLPLKKLVSSLYQNYTSKRANNILINGQSGVGKTKSIELLSEVLDIPVSIINVASFTQSGYVGSSIDEILQTVYAKAGNDLERAEHSIVVLDELDKKASPSESLEKIGSIGFLNELLGYLSGNTYNITVSPRSPKININTTNMTFIGLGAFSNIEETVSRQVGFGKEMAERNYQNISNENFIKYGFPPELIGRFPVKIKMNQLTEADLVQILKYSEISPLNEKIQYLKEHFKIELICPDEVLTLIAQAAIKEKTGARSLFEKIENIFCEEIIFELALNYGKYQKLILTPETITNPKKFILR